MEISGVSSKAYTSAAQGVDEEEKVEEEQEEQSTQKAQEYGVSAKEKEDKDVTKFSSSDYGESDVEEKAQNYICRQFDRRISNRNCSVYEYI